MGVVDVAIGALSSLSVIVDVEGLREKPERGPRWVSFNSIQVAVVSNVRFCRCLLFGCIRRKDRKINIMIRTVTIVNTKRRDGGTAFK